MAISISNVTISIIIRYSFSCMSVVICLVGMTFVYTPVDVATERIYPCKEWQSTYIPELEDYYDRYMLPEIVNPLFKPSYFL